MCENDDESCVVNMCMGGRGRMDSYKHKKPVLHACNIGYCLTLNQLYCSAVWAVGRSLRERETN